MKYLRKASLLNIIISALVAIATYYSLTLIAKGFGGSLGSDAYFLLVAFVNFSSGIFASILGTVFLPAFIRVKTYEDELTTQTFISSIFTWYVFFSFLVGVPAFIWNEEFFLLVTRFNESQISDSSSILVYFAPIFIAGLISEFFRVIILAVGEFTYAAIAAFFHPLFLIIFLLLFKDDFDEPGLAASLMAAKFLSLVVHYAIVRLKGIHVRLNFRFGFHTSNFFKCAGPYWSANVITNTATYYFDYQASGLGSGVVTALAYAKSFVMLPIVVFVTPILEIFRTKFAQFQSVDDAVSLNDNYNNLIKYIIIFSVPISVFYFAFSHEVVSALLQGGDFQINSVNLTAEILTIYGLSIPLTSVFMVNGRVCESYQKLFWLSFFGTIGNSTMILITWLLTDLIGYQGIPYAKLIVESIYYLPFGFIGFHLLGGKPKFTQIITSTFTCVVSSATAGIIISLMTNKYAGVPFGLHYVVYQFSAYIFVFGIMMLLLSANVRTELRNIIH